MDLLGRARDEFFHHVPLSHEEILKPLLGTFDQTSADPPFYEGSPLCFRWTRSLYVSLLIEFVKKPVRSASTELIDHANRAIKMSASLKRRLEETQSLLDNLRVELSKGTPIIVEGKNDAKALKKIVASGDIICAKASGRSFLDVLREIEKREKDEIILLMDFDKRGRQWTKRLADDLERMKVRPNLVFWRRLFSLIGRDVKDIEGLSTYLETLRRRIGKNVSQ